MFACFWFSVLQLGFQCFYSTKIQNRFRLTVTIVVVVIAEAICIYLAPVFIDRLIRSNCLREGEGLHYKASTLTNRFPCCCLWVDSPYLSSGIFSCLPFLGTVRLNVDHDRILETTHDGKNQSRDI